MSLPSPSIASSDATLVPSSSSAFGGGQQTNGETINVQIFVPEYNVQKCLHANLDDTVWEVKQKILTLLPKDMQEGFNYGLFLPPCNGRAGKFLLEERPLKDYPFQDCVPYLELKYKKRVYKMLNLDEKSLKQLHTKATLKKFLEYVEERQAEKVEKLCAQGLDPNFHDSTGETPLTIASSVDDNRDVLLALTSGGAHLDFRNMEGQTALHKASFLTSHSNAKTLLELGASPNYKDPLGLTSLYYCMLKTNTNANTAELLLRDYSELGVTDPHGNHEVHQACKNGLVPHLEHLLFYGAEINCQNVNGNTPLHVCSVNNQEACARVLLFRGADGKIVNNQGQTAFHVAVITGHQGVAELIRSHDAATAVPYRGMPRYNSKRRLARRSPASTPSSSAMGRTKSFVGSASASECGYGTMRGALTRTHGVRPVSEAGTPASSIAPSPNVVRHSALPCGQQRQQQIEHQQYGVPSGQHSHQHHLQHQQQHRGLHQTQSAMPAFSGMQTMPSECRPAVLQMIKKSVSEQNAMAAGGGHLASVRGVVDNTAVAPIQRIPPEMAMQFGAPTVLMNSDVNIPRILVIPRGPKGFGFILRGAKKVDATVNFEPTPEIPALQYFEGVDMNGMAMKAGLKPGDFLLEINGNDVRCASHDQVVRLIQMSGETITLKVITIDPNEPLPPTPYYGTYRRNSKAVAAPPPPLRHPATSLSIAAGRSMAGGLARYDDYAIGGSMAIHGHHHQSRSIMYPNATMGAAKSIEHLPVAYRDPRDKVASVRGRVNSRRISAAELEQLMARQNSNGGGSSQNGSFNNEPESPGTPNSFRSASNGGGPKVYNSVAEMKRQKRTQHQQQQQQQSQTSRGSIILIDAGNGTTSNNSSTSANGSGGGSLKSFHSSPDLQATELSLVRDYSEQIDQLEHQQQIYDAETTSRRRNESMDGDRYYSSGSSSRHEKNGYGAPTSKSAQRPKTPPPAPPINSINGSRLTAVRSAPPPPPQPGKAAPAPPPPPPPPPLPVPTSSNEERYHQQRDASFNCRSLQYRNYKQSEQQPHIPEPDYDDPPMEDELPPISNTAPPPPPPPPPPPIPQAPCNDLKSALAMKRQQILSKSSSNPSDDGAAATSIVECNASKNQGNGEQQQQNGVSEKADFNSDLKNAIARRRTQLDKQQKPGSALGVQSSGDAAAATTATKTNSATDTKSTRVVGMSLKESVQNNIQTNVGGVGRKNVSGGNGNGTTAMAAKNGKTVGSTNAGGGGNNSPPISNGFAHKKDSGFSSSRNSLEPSECEETASSSGSNGDGQDAVVVGNEDTLRQHRVSFLSHQLEDSIGTTQIRGRPPMQAMKPSSSHATVTKQHSSSATDQQDAISLASTLSTLSGCSDATGSSSALSQQQQQQRHRQSDSIPPMPRGPPPVPPPDYDAADSGTGDSENDDVTPTLSQQNLAHQSGSFRNKSLIGWTMADVCDWLDSLYLSEYKRGFSRSQVDGRRLLNCDRTQFTQLGVTRIAHRIAMENSLKEYKSETNSGRVNF